MSGKITEKFREIIEYRWDEFVEMENALDGTNFDSIVTAIARAAKKGNLRAIQTALDRLDGKIATEIEVEYPKFFTIFPRAEKTADDPSIIDYQVKNDHGMLTFPATDGVVVLESTPKGHNEIYELAKGAAADMDEHAVEEEELPTGSLRAVLEKQLESPKSLVAEILDAADRIDGGDYTGGNPMVKSVIVAGLMKLVHEGRITAVFEVFDQIDGKVADKYKVLGSDVYLTNYATIAPAGAVKNDEGVYMIEAENTTNAWVARLEERNNAKKLR